MRDRIRIQTYRPPWGDMFLQVLISKHEDNKVFVVKELEWEELSPAQLADPTLYLKYDDAQDLMDSLWSSGLRPTEGSGSAGALAATQEHLKDMRQLVFKFMENR